MCSGTLKPCLSLLCKLCLRMPRRKHGVRIPYLSMGANLQNGAAPQPWVLHKRWCIFLAIQGAVSAEKATLSRCLLYRLLCDLMVASQIVGDEHFHP